MRYILIVVLLALIGYIPSTLNRYTVPPYIYHPFKMEFLKNSTLVINRVPNNFESNSQREWEKIGHTLINTPHKYIVIKWQGYGGLLSIGQRFIDQMNVSKQRGHIINIDVIGGSYSVHANVVCNSSFYRLVGEGFLYFHAPFDITKKGKKIYVQQRRYFTACVNKGILSNAEVDRIMIAHKAIIVDEDRHYETADQTTYLRGGK